MKRILLILTSVIFPAMVYSQTGTISNINVNQRTDGSGMVDVFFDLSGPDNAYNIIIQVSFDGGNSYDLILPTFLEGDFVNISPESNKHIVWDGLGSFPDCYSENAILKLIASRPSGNATPCPDYPFLVDIRDGNIYNTVKIGSQCWLKENLAWLPEVYPPSDLSGSGRFYVYEYNGSQVSEATQTENYKNYGALYNRAAALNACPTGWRLPTRSEFYELINYLGGSSIAGGILKSNRTQPDPEPSWNYPNTDATDYYGFSATPGGRLISSFNGKGATGGFYTSSFVQTWAWGYWPVFTLSYNSGQISEYKVCYNCTDESFSVRCLKD